MIPVSNLVIYVTCNTTSNTMELIKKALKNVIDCEQKRSLLVSLSHDQELVIKGDNVSVSNLEQNETAKDALKTILTEMAEEDETSYNFGGQLTFSETDILDFPKMFAKMGGKKWKGGKNCQDTGKVLFSSWLRKEFNQDIWKS